MGMKRILSSAASLIMAAAVLTGCGRTNGYEGFTVPDQGGSTLQPVDTCFMENHYEGVPPKKEKVTRSVSSADGLCRIDCMESYYDVTLDYEKGSSKEVGAAYAEALMAVYPDYQQMCESYIYENIKAEFNDLKGDYSAIGQRVENFYNALCHDYRQELDGFAEGISGDSQGLKEDGIISHDEAILMQFIPDVLRVTSCSALSADGKTTATGERITCRVLEWMLGSDNQICRAHALVHMKNGDKSYVSVTYLGFMTILTAVNEDGLMLGELDVGSKKMVKYICEGRKSYTYDMRYAIENFTNAREAAEYLTANAEKYPYCVNILATDKKDAFVAELCVTDEDGTSVVRDSSTELNNGVKWDDPNYLCAVNSFAAKGNADELVFIKNNRIRWDRYNQLFSGQRDITIGRFKELMTCEKTDNVITRIRSKGMVHMVIADYSTDTLQAVLTGKDGVVASPEFIDLGSWK